MQSALPLNDMSTEEKLQIMESIWSDLCAHGEREIESPEWHRHALEARESALEHGDDAIEDWENAKQKIHNDLA